MELGVKEEQVYESIQKLDSIHKPHYSPMSSDFHESFRQKYLSNLGGGIKKQDSQNQQLNLGRFD